MKIHSYNHPRKFDNGIVWFRLGYRGPGLWFSRHRPYFWVLLPGHVLLPPGIHSDPPYDEQQT